MLPFFCVCVFSKMEQVRKNSGDEQKRFTTELQKAQESARVANKKLKEVKKEVQAAKEERDTLSAEHQLLLKEQAKLNLMISDLREEVSGNKDSRVSTI